MGLTKKRQVKRITKFMIKIQSLAYACLLAVIKYSKVFIYLVPNRTGSVTFATTV